MFSITTPIYFPGSRVHWYRGVACISLLAQRQSPRHLPHHGNTPPGSPRPGLSQEALLWGASWVGSGRGKGASPQPPPMVRMVLGANLRKYHDCVVCRYPGDLAWSVPLSKKFIRKSPLASKFHSFLVRENEQVHSVLVKVQSAM